MTWDDSRLYVPQIVPDHEGRAGGGWQNKSPDPAGQAPRLVIGWTASL